MSDEDKCGICGRDHNTERAEKEMIPQEAYDILVQFTDKYVSNMSRKQFLEDSCLWLVDFAKRAAHKPVEECTFEVTTSGIRPPKIYPVVKVVK